MSFDPANIQSTDLPDKTTFVDHSSSSVLSYEYCQTLIKTYNASILKKLPESLQESFLTTAKDCLKKNKVETTERTVLATLINNLDNEKITPTLPNVGFIEGPLNISLHWSKTFQKLIYIFGELHTGKMCQPDVKESTTKIEDYLAEWFRKPTAYTDFFLEEEGFVIPYGYKDVVYTDERTISMLRKKFNSCIDKITRDTNPDCNTSRMHFFDIRKGDIKGGIPYIPQIYIRLFINLKYIEERFETIQDEELLDIYLDLFMHYKHWFEKIANFNDQEYKEFIYNELYEFNIIKKEINRMNENVQPYLNYYIEKKLTEYTDMNTYKHIQKRAINIQSVAFKILEIGNLFILFKEGKIEKIEKIKFGHFYNNLNYFFVYITLICALFTDVYLLARIFKTFQINDPEKRRLVDEPSEPHNIIIYAGNGHSSTCREFLDLIGFKTLEKSGKCFDFEWFHTDLTYEKCIDMKEENLDKTNTITQPLFNRWPSEDDNGFVPFDEKFGMETLKKYESFEKTFNIKPDDTMSEPEIPEYKTQSKKERGVRVSISKKKQNIKRKK